MDLAIDQRGVGNRWSLAATGWSGWGLPPITHVAQGQSCLAGRSAGRIVTERGQLQAVYGRWWPHSGNMLQVYWDQLFRGLARDRCELFYHAPLSAPQFLTVDFVHSGPATSWGTLYAASLILDEIAKIRGASAIVGHVTNRRISDRLLRRWGWEAHCLNWKGRHFIKRFYGTYPVISGNWRARLTLD